MTKPVVFISHTSHDPLGRALSTELHAALSSKGFNPFLHEGDLSVGSDWQPKIEDCMHNCDAAVILVTQSALGRDWVRREATILGSRWGSEQNQGGTFPLLALCFDGTEAYFDKDWHAALGRVNRKKVDAPSNGRSGHGDFPQEVARVVNWVVTELLTRCPPLEAALSVPGDHHGVHRLNELINERAEALRVHNGSKAGVSGEALARRLLTMLVRSATTYHRLAGGDADGGDVGTLAAAREVREIGDVVFTLDTVREIFDWLDLFLTDPNAAALLHAAFYEKTDGSAQARRVLLLRLEHPRCVSLHLRRALQPREFSNTRPMHVERADPPERLADAVRQAIEDLKRDIAPDPVKTAVVSLQGPVSDDAFAKIRSACQPYRFPIAFVVFGSGAGAAQGADALIVTVYDGSNAEPQLIQHRCDAYATLRQRKRWKAIACCEDNDLQQREEPRP